MRSANEAARAVRLGALPVTMKMLIVKVIIRQEVVIGSLCKVCGLMWKLQ